jgi:hypothetical protein
MYRVMIESPLKADTPEGVDRNISYARAAMRDSLARGEAPLASHLLYAQPGILDDQVVDQRHQGMQAGWAWLLSADRVAVYQDLGITPGMRRGIEIATNNHIPVEYRELGGWRNE